MTLVSNTDLLKRIMIQIYSVFPPTQIFRHSVLKRVQRKADKTQWWYALSLTFIIDQSSANTPYNPASIWQIQAESPCAQVHIAPSVIQRTYNRNLGGNNVKSKLVQTWISCTLSALSNPVCLTLGTRVSTAECFGAWKDKAQLH